MRAWKSVNSLWISKMQKASFLRRTSLLLFPSRTKPDSTPYFNQIRAQSSSPLDSVTNLLGDHVKSVSLNPFKFYVNLWRLAKYRANYDKIFQMEDFQLGAKKAFAVVTRKLFLMDFDGLHGLVSEEALNRLRPVVEALTPTQREILDLDESDVYGQFLFSAGFEKSVSGNDFFEILMAFHCFRQMEQYRSQGGDMSVSKLLENKERFVLSNMKFAKRLTPAVDSDWTVSYANYARMEASSPGFTKFPPAKKE